jgi:hypothetical protein
MPKSNEWYKDKNNMRIRTLIVDEDYTYDPLNDSGGIFIVPVDYEGTFTLTTLADGDTVTIILQEDDLAAANMVLTELYHGGTDIYAGAITDYGWAEGVYEIGNFSGKVMCLNNPTIPTE